jgi:hypothetical protein
MKKLFLVLILLTSFTVNSQKICSVNSKFDADIKVYVVDSQFDAGWRESSKKHLLY